MHRPHVILIGGPNGAGKTTIAPTLLRDFLEVPVFVNADTIAQGLAGFEPHVSEFQAGKVMLARLAELAASRSDFAFETTLASRSFAPWLLELRRTGYHCHVLFIWLPSVEMALERVAQRVRLGGHDVPPEVVHRRFQRGLHNFTHLYQPAADTWAVYDNSKDSGPRIVASGGSAASTRIADEDTWERIRAATA